MSTVKKDENKINIETSLKDEVPDTPTQDDLIVEIANQLPIDNTTIIKNVNNKVLLDILSPEISKNELSKRAHKYILIILLAIFLVVQFSSIFLISTKVINYAISSESDIQIVQSLLRFVSAYITSVVVELIAILKYIVRNVFDTSLAELVKLFKDTDYPKKE